MNKKPGQFTSLTKKVIDRVSGRNTNADSHPQEPRRLITESLEPRVLYSGSPVPAPDVPAVDLGPASVREGTPPPASTISPDSFTSPPSQSFPEATGTRIPLTPDEVSDFLFLARPGYLDRLEPSIEVVGFGYASEIPSSSIPAHSAESASSRFGWSLFFATPIRTDTFSSPGEPASTYGTAPEDLLKAIGAEVLLDPSLFDSAPSAPPGAECAFFGTVAISVFGSMGRIGSSPSTRYSHAALPHQKFPLSARLFNSRTTSDLHSKHGTSTGPRTATFPASTGIEATTSDPPLPHARPPHTPFPTVALTSGGQIAYPTHPLPTHAEAPGASFLQAPTGSITVGGYTRDQESRESDRLFIDIPGFDFTTLPSGNHSSLIHSAQPLVLATPATTGHPSTGKPAQQKHRQPSPSLPDPVVGTSFAGDAFSAEAWFTAPHSGDVSTLLFRIDDECGMPRAFSVSLFGSDLVITHRTAGFRYRDHSFTVPNVITEAGTLHHLVFTRKNCDFSIFLDATDVTPDHRQISGMTIFGNRASFRPSGKKNASSPNSAVSEFALYGYALDPYTIFTHYHSKFTQISTGPRKRPSDPREFRHRKVYVGGGGLFSRSSNRLGGSKSNTLSLSDLDSSGSPLSPPVAPSDPHFGTLQAVLDRVPHDFLDTGTSAPDLGFFISDLPEGTGAEIKSLSWDVTESILAHFGVTYRLDSASSSNFSHSLFISDEPSDPMPLGIIASVDDSGRITSVSPLEFAPGSLAIHPFADLLAALKYHPSSLAGLSPSSGGGSESDQEGGLHLARMSSVQSDVFGIREH